MSQVTAVTLSDGTVVNTFPNSIDGELVSRAFTELFAQIQSQATDIAENDAIIDQLRADLAARATAEQSRAEDAHVIKRLSGVLAEVAAALFGEEADGNAADILAKLPERAATLTLEVELYRVSADRNNVIEECCAAIKAEDDRMADDDYMLDSNDCIKVCRALKSQQDAAIESTEKTS